MSGLDAQRYKRETYHRPILLLIEGFALLISIKEAIGWHGSFDSLVISKSKFLQAILQIFFLRNKGAILLFSNLKPKEKLHFTHHGHLIFLRHHLGKFFADFRVSTAKDNIIYIYLTHK